MGDETEEREELLNTILELRRRIAGLEKQHSGTTDCPPPVSETALLPGNHFQELVEPPQPLRSGYESTETIDLRSLLTRDVSESGSFEVRGEIWATTFGKLMQALPIPALLIDEYLDIVVANQACGRFTPVYEEVQGKPFPSLVIGSSAARAARSLLRSVFDDRKPRVAEGTLRIDNATLWARMTFRPIRMMGSRFVLMLLEDLTPQKLQLRENERLLLELEKRVAKRTEDLRKTNEHLMREIAERKRAEEEREKVVVELQQALADVKKLSGFLPICASCKKIRDDEGYWQEIEQFITEHSEALFSHGLCPECAQRLYPGFAR
ncbi:MAG: PAS domain-containing protein [Thermodesulfobacteriota bacterium]